ncbi:MAG: hypothetical protein E6Q76_04365 [Rhizobium sp.]|nr:MAG: hypothetical protein E6Q76_04365 [Rhizobium sp.]
MSMINEFIAELIRAANESTRLTRIEKMRLIDRAVTTIRDLRMAAGIPVSKTSADGLIDLQTVAALIDAGEAGERSISSALLDAAAMIRDLHIVLDTNTHIEIAHRNPDETSTS